MVGGLNSTGRTIVKVDVREEDLTRKKSNRKGRPEASSIHILILKILLADQCNPEITRRLEMSTFLIALPIIMSSTANIKLIG